MDDGDWMNDACNALVFKDGVREMGCQCPGLEAGILRGLEMARTHLRDRGHGKAATEMTALIAKHKEGK